MTTSIRADVQSVLHLAKHFVELKSRAAKFLVEFSANERGHFTPTEDDQARQLLVSYWQSRNALLELVIAYQGTEIREDDDPMRFLAAFGGALVLIDAARFIRDEMHHKPVVRAKLNEPEPHFDIPAGCYDQIQKSLTSPVHAWHLYHANDHFEEKQTQIAEAVSGDAEFEQLLELVHSLRDRLKVSVNSFARARVRVQARRVRTRVTRDVVGRAMYGLQKAVSKLVSDVYVRPKHVPQLPPRIVDELGVLLQPGDILVTRKEHAATNYFLPGYWPHAALFVGDEQYLARQQLNQHQNVTKHWDEIVTIDKGQPGRVVEAMKDGVRMRSVATPFKCDAITVLRAKLTGEALSEVIARAFFHVGKAYDFDFDFSRSDRMVCSEVVYRSFDGVDGTEFELRKRAGRLTLAPEDLMRMALDRNTFDVVASFVPSRSEGMQLGDGAAEFVRATIGA